MPSTPNTTKLSRNLSPTEKSEGISERKITKGDTKGRGVLAKCRLRTCTLKNGDKELDQLPKVVRYQG